MIPFRIRVRPARYMLRTLDTDGRRYSPIAYATTRGNAGLRALGALAQSPFVARVEIVSLASMRVVATLAQPEN